MLQYLLKCNQTSQCFCIFQTCYKYFQTCHKYFQTCYKYFQTCYKYFQTCYKYFQTCYKYFQTCYKYFQTCYKYFQTCYKYFQTCYKYFQTCYKYVISIDIYSKFLFNYLCQHKLFSVIKLQNSHLLTSNSVAYLAIVVRKRDIYVFYCSMPSRLSRFVQPAEPVQFRKNGYSTRRIHYWRRS